MIKIERARAHDKEKFLASKVRKLRISMSYREESTTPILLRIEQDEPSCTEHKNENGRLQMLYIGIDLGTSAVKLLLMDSEGKIVNIVSREYPLYFPHPGWSEQKPEDWYTQTMDGIKELIRDVDKSQVAGISFGGQMHGLVILDKDDNVIRPAILWKA